MTGLGDFEIDPGRLCTETGTERERKRVLGKEWLVDDEMTKYQYTIGEK